MNIGESYTYIRKLAKSDYWQTVFSMGERTKIKLFENESDFTKSQILFLKYLNFYSQIYMDIALGDITTIVLENEIYEDSYYLYKNNKDKEKFKNIDTNRQDKTPTTTWLFKKRQKK